MSKTLKKVNVRFDDTTLMVDETFPPDLEGLIDHADFEAVIRKINVELNSELLEARVEMQRWATVFAATAVFIIGLIFTPVVAVKAKRYREALGQFWDDVKAHLSIVNRRANAKRQQRWIEWHIKQSGYHKRGTDVFDPFTVFQVLVIAKYRVKKEQGGYQAKQFHRATDIQDGADADTSFTGLEDRSTIAPTLLAGPSDRRVSFITPMDSSTTTTTVDASKRSSASTIDDGSIPPGSDTDRSGRSVGLGGAAAAAAVAGAATIGVAAAAAIKEESAEEDRDVSEAERGDQFDAAPAVAAAPLPASATDRHASIAPVVEAQRPVSTTSIEGMRLDEGARRMSTSSMAPISEMSASTAPAQSNRMSTASLASITPVVIGAGAVGAAAVAAAGEEEKKEPAEEAGKAVVNEETEPPASNRDSIMSIAPINLEESAATKGALPTLQEEDEEITPVTDEEAIRTAGETQDEDMEYIAALPSTGDKRSSVRSIEALVMPHVTTPMTELSDEDEKEDKIDSEGPESKRDTLSTLADGSDTALPAKEMVEDDVSSEDSMLPIAALHHDMPPREGDMASPVPVMLSSADEDVPEHLSSAKRVLNDSDSGSII